MIRKLKSISLYSVYCTHYTLYCKHDDTSNEWIKRCDPMSIFKWNSQIHNRMPKSYIYCHNMHVHLEFGTSLNFIVSIAFDNGFFSSSNSISFKLKLIKVMPIIRVLLQLLLLLKCIIFLKWLNTYGNDVIPVI